MPLIDPPISKSLDRLPRHTRLNPSASLRLLPNFGLASLALGVILLGPFQHTLELTGCDQPIELGEAFRREQIERRLRGRRVCELGELAPQFTICDLKALDAFIETLARRLGLNRFKRGEIVGRQLAGGFVTSRMR